MKAYAPRVIAMVCLVVSFAFLTHAQQSQSSAESEETRFCRPGVPEPCVHAPTPRYNPDPEYSKEGRQRGAQGDVQLSIVIGVDGSVTDAVIEKPLGFGLDELALKAVRQWRFVPATLQGQPVSARVKVRIAFRLYNAERIERGRTSVSAEFDDKYPLKTILPKYTKEAKKNRIIGSLTVSATITKAGDVKDVKVVNGLGYGLDEETVKAVKRWKYRPIAVEGEPVEVATTVTFAFNLR